MHYNLIMLLEALRVQVKIKLQMFVTQMGRVKWTSIKFLLFRLISKTTKFEQLTTWLGVSCYPD